MEGQMDRAVFIRKAIHIGELKAPYEERFANPFTVERIAEMEPEDFKKFGEELYEYYRVLYDNRDAMHFDMGCRRFHCLLVTTPERKEGILVQSEGYAYARYAAYVPDCGRLELGHVEVLREVSLSHDIPSTYYHTDVSGTPAERRGSPERQGER